MKFLKIVLLNEIFKNHAINNIILKNVIKWNF